MPTGGANSERVLVLAPRGRDAKVAAQLLREGLLSPHVCADIADLCDQLEIGAGLALIAEESVVTADLRALRRWLQNQAAWSDLPIVLLTLQGNPPERTPDAKRLLDIFGNVSFLERPFHPTTLVSMVRSALRARRRQYQARAMLEGLEAGEERLRLFIEHAPAAMVMVDRNMHYLAVSQRWMHDFHLSGPVIGRSHYDVFPDIPEAWRQGHQRCLAGAAEKTDADRLARADGTVRWLKRDVRPWRDPQGNIGGLIISWEDVTATRAAVENEKLLARELQHRTKNLIAVIQSIARGSFPATDPHRDAFYARLQALAEAQDLLTNANWSGALLEDVIRRELAGFVGRISINGPRVFLKPNAVQGFALVLHELATNAAKYGALSVARGKISISWSVEKNSTEPSLVFDWQERGGPPAKPPERRGFGSILLKNALSTGSQPSFVYGSEGFSYQANVEFAIETANAE
jgi:PAS domain S-box-containing protein